jgi:hypothetical protein
MTTRILATAALLFALGAGCKQKVFDCHDICETVRQCVQGDIDVSDCTIACGDFAADSDTTQAEVEQCNDCLDVNACDNTAACQQACLPLLAAAQ